MKSSLTLAVRGSDAAPEALPASAEFQFTVFTVMFRAASLQPSSARIEPPLSPQFPRDWKLPPQWRVNQGSGRYSDFDAVSTDGFNGTVQYLQYCSVVGAPVSSSLRCQRASGGLCSKAGRGRPCNKQRGVAPLQPLPMTENVGCKIGA